MADTDLCDTNELRTVFSKAMSRMYQDEVPLYSDLLDIVTEVNGEVLGKSGLDYQHETDIDIARITLERHGAIRLGTPTELATIRRLFAQLGMFPVGYYDLSIAGLPMHATAFRPLAGEALRRNPFRIFTTLLRPELLSEEPRRLAQEILSSRNIFPAKLMELLGDAERRGGVLKSQVDDFIRESLSIFRWQKVAVATYEKYLELKAEHPILADVVSFPTSHINHLTPRTLDIDLAQDAMQSRGMQAKERIEGPPRRKFQILLRQTSFKALNEQVDFPASSSGHDMVRGVHSARFGEIEQRGWALTKEGRALYDRLIVETSKSFAAASSQSQTYDEILEHVFKQFPDDVDALQKQGLVFCRYKLTKKWALSQWAGSKDVSSLPYLVSKGLVTFQPITYEDFLPFSAAGIFQSNLGTSGSNTDIVSGTPDQEQFEKCLGQKTADPMELYQEMESQSISDIWLEMEKSRPAETEAPLSIAHQVPGISISIR
ncbi:unnamed protein product [Clonostachys rhizophaga]|uniref:2-oxoadipate dioxygenase/decarboxylase n=1 Tax=Clonostachys rhizophaga TaxID=160324 RepID=A0A9N9VKT7_9HYPO|nr:unnamed protein product [Clonostachys rhizophaga]